MSDRHHSDSCDHSAVQAHRHLLRDKWGKVPLCNGRPERAPHIGSFCFPLCWRCTGFAAGAILAAVLDALKVPGVSLLYDHLMVCLILIVPMAVDGARQEWSNYESRNPIRFVTGFLAGIGAVWFLFGVLFS